MPVRPATSPNTDFKTEIKTIHANMMVMIVSGDDDDGVRGDNNNDDDDDAEQGFKVARR